MGTDDGDPEVRKQPQVRLGVRAVLVLLPSMPETWVCSPAKEKRREGEGERKEGDSPRISNIHLNTYLPEK